MNNEEQILSVLNTLISTVSTIASKVEIIQTDIDIMKADIASLKADIASLKAGQAKLEAGLAETNKKLEQLTIKVDCLTDKTDRLEAHALRIDSTQSDILGKLDSLAAEDSKIIESMYKFDDSGRERHYQIMKKIDTIQRVTKVNTCDIAELRAALDSPFVIK